MDSWHMDSGTQKNVFLLTLQILYNQPTGIARSSMLFSPPVDVSDLRMTLKTK